MRWRMAIMESELLDHDWHNCQRDAQGVGLHVQSALRATENCRRRSLLPLLSLSIVPSYAQTRPSGMPTPADSSGQSAGGRRDEYEAWCSAKTSTLSVADSAGALSPYQQTEGIVGVG